ncbi:hypothetical protein Chor_013058, partial [Crotalus horridus]
MSRLIVKNLPNGIKEERFRHLFAAFGTLTDCCLKFTKDGKFRKFGFIGFQSEEDAKTAQSHFNKSFIDTSRVTGGTKKKNKMGQLKELEGEAAFQDFLTVHQKRSQVATWSNDTKIQDPHQAEVVEDYLNFDSDEDSSEEMDAEVAQKKGESSPSKATVQQELSDMDYLRSKVVKGHESSPSSADESEAEETDSEASDGGDEGEAEGKISRKPATASNMKTKQTGKENVQDLSVDTKTTKMTSQQNVKEFFVPLRPLAIRIVRNAHGNKTGYVFVDFNTEEELQKALKRNREYMGPVSEIHFPVDGLTKRPKGFAFVTYMFPEHAVKAFAEVDGQVFQGRMLHVLPSTIKKEEVESSDPAGSSSYKKQKASKDKANSLSSHNWNTLFMGTNAVADAVAQKYNATKSQVLDHAAGERSKTVILVKNLPAATKAEQLEEVFQPFGSLGRFQHIPLYLEWAPTGVFSGPGKKTPEVFSKAGVVRSCTVSKKKDKAVLLSIKACSVDGHQLEVKISERATKSTVGTARKKQVSKKQVNSKILVRNIPFQATVKEIRELF